MNEEHNKTEGEEVVEVAETATVADAACKHCDNCKEGTCCADCKGESTVSVHSADEPLVCQAGMCGNENSWKWYFVVGAVAVIFGIIIGSAAGSAKARRHMNGPEMAHDMTAMMHMMNAELEGKKGDDLDRAFLEQMIVHHQGAIEMASILKAGTERPELTKLADDIISAQNKEVGMMEAWLGTWFK